MKGKAKHEQYKGNVPWVKFSIVRYMAAVDKRERNGKLNRWKSLED